MAPIAYLQFDCKLLYSQGLLKEKCIERGLSQPDKGGHVKMKQLHDSQRHSCKVVCLQLNKIVKCLSIDILINIKKVKFQPHFLLTFIFLQIPNTEQPFACTDLIFLTQLLEQLVGLKAGDILHSSKSIEGMTAEWPLASAFYVYQNGL